MLHSMLNFPKNEGDSRKLKKVKALVQHFSEQLRHFAPKQNCVSIGESLINYEEEKKEEEKKVWFVRTYCSVCENPSLQILPWHLAIAKDFAEGNLYFL